MTSETANMNRERTRLTPDASPLTASMPTYQVERVKFTYPHRPAREWVLDGLTFDVRAGEILGVIGPNGSGKTSLLKLLAHVLTSQEGVVRLFGRDLAHMRQDAVARAVALVPQDSPEVFPFTIGEMVLMGRFPHRARGWNLGGFGWESTEDIQLAEKAMRETDVAHLASRLIRDVSGGERQRAIIARALTQQPQVLLLDEPTAFLDLNHQVDICSLLQRLNDERGLTVVLVSHDLNLASQYCDRLLLLNEGTVFCIGPPEDVIRLDVLKSVYGCEVLVDLHPTTGTPRVTLPGRTAVRPEARTEKREASGQAPPHA